MSKTWKELGLIIGGIGIALLAGPVGIVALEGNLAVMNAMIGIGLTTALSGVGLALRQTPKTVGTNGNVTFGGGISPRRVIFGQYQTAGICTYASFPPSQNQSTVSQYLHLIYTLTGHEISSFDAVMIDGTVYNFGTDIIWDAVNGHWNINPGSSVGQSDFYWQHVFFEFDFGRNLNFQPFPTLATADSSWTSACVQQGCAKVHVILRADSGWTALFPSGQIPNIQFLLTGKKLIDPRVITAWQASSGYLKYRWVADNFGVLWVQQNTSGTSGSSRPNFEANDTPGTTLSDGTLSWKSSGLNMTTISTGADGNPQGHIVNARLVNDSWQPGVGYGLNAIVEAPLGYLQMSTSSGLLGGSTEPAFNLALGGTTTDGSQTWVCLGRSWHAINPSNSALCVNDYLQDADAGMGVPASAIDIASVIAAANVCENQAVIIVNADSTSVSENLYSCNGMFDHTSVRGNVLTSLCSSMAGWVVPPGDQWHVFAGAYVTPAIALTDGDMRAPIKGDFRLSKRDVANGIKGNYVPAFLPTNPGGALSMTQVPGTWKSQSYPSYQANGLAGKPNYLLEDGNQIIWQDLQLDFTTSLWTAQRLAKIALMRLRFQETLTLPCKLTALQIEAGDTFSFTHARWNILSAAFEAMQVSITFETGKDGSPAVGVDIIARQTDPSVYAFQGPTSSTNYGEYSPYGITGVMTGVE